MAQTFYIATMGCSVRDYDRIIVRGDSVVQNMYGEYASEFPSPLIDKSSFTGILKDARDAQTAVKEGGGSTEKATRDQLVGLLHTSIKQKVISYANRLYLFDKVKLMHSGCAVIKERTIHGIPPQQIIKKVVPGHEPLSAKVMMTKIILPTDVKKESYTYILWMTTDAANNSDIMQVMISKDSRKLVAKGLTRLLDVYFMVSVINTAGESPLSEKVRFTAVQ